jgi:hypothetical protein
MKPFMERRRDRSSPLRRTPYLPLEANYKLTRQCLQICAEFQNPVGVITKSAMIRRDIAMSCRNSQPQASPRRVLHNSFYRCRGVEKLSSLTRLCLMRVSVAIAGAVRGGNYCWHSDSRL